VNNQADDQEPVRPARIDETPVPPLPPVDGMTADKASVTLSTHRTRLSTHRTQLSEHRTQLSEYRTDLSKLRTKLSTARTEMSTRRTGMSFQRTRMSADRTLMSVIRTSLSLIGFGFTIFQIFQKMHEAKLLPSAAPARHFGTGLLALGVLMLTLGIVYHLAFMRELRNTRARMHDASLIHAESGFPISLTLMTALLLLLLGLAAIASVVWQIGPLN
jgi:uncharacterized membrane protein YidH (DUF202 family)